MTPTVVLGSLLAFSALALATLAGWMGAALIALAVGRSRTLGVSARAALLAQVRLLPLALAAVLVPVQITAFARYEAGGAESAGPLLLGAAAVGLYFLLDAIASTLASWRQTRAIVATWRASALPLPLPGWARRSWGITRRFPVVAVIGITRPQLFVATQVVDECTAAELAAIVTHETAHVRSRDNLVRLLFRLTPGARVFAAIALPLERAWQVAAEEAADTHARDEAGRLDLASALTKVARLAAACESESTVGSALIGGHALQSRVRRLLAPRADERIGRTAWLPIALMLAGAAVVPMTPLLASLHEAFELMVRR